MKKNNFSIFKYIFAIFTIVGILQPMIVHGSTQFKNAHMKQAEWIPNIYLNKVKPNGTVAYQQGGFIRRIEDNMWVYCIQPGVAIDSDIIYYGSDSDWALVSGLTQNQWDKISLLAYYGYNYSEDGYNHSENKWYVITQMEIWKVVTEGKGWDFYYTDSLNGNKIDGKFSAEIQELHNLVNSHFKTPSFANADQKLAIGDSITLTDANTVLEKYNSVTTSNGNASATIAGNNLVIKAENVGSTDISLKKTTSKWKTPPIVYVNPKSQDVISVGDFDPVEIKLNIEVYGGKVTINKLDKDTNSNITLISSESSLQGAVYGIYDKSNTLITTATTNADGTVTSNFLPALGDYYLKEITPSKGYQLDTTQYNFKITKEDLFPTIKTYQKIINRDVELVKVYASGETGFLKPEEGIVFGFYNSEGIKVKEATTDKTGYLKTNLPYGRYNVKQENSSPNTEKVDDFEIKVSEMGESYRYTISNAKITAKLKVIKIDEETKETISMSGIKFKIFDLTKNEYVCQTITYPNAGKICEFETDENGILITPYPLTSGRYLLEEVDQIINGYLWNSKQVEFEIGEDSNLIADEEFGILLEVSFSNKQVKGQLVINKQGEKLNIEDGTYSYEKINLEGVKFGLYASEDIIINGYKYYSKGELIIELITDELGSVIYGDLPLGKYYIKELETVNGHVLDNKIYNFEIKYADQYTETIYYTLTLENKLPKGELEFTKTDLVNDRGLPNTKIEIYDEFNNLIFTGITDEEGKIIIKDLFGGKFYIIETEAPEGYILNTEKIWFEITSDGEIVKANMTNEKIVDVPSTGINKINFAYIDGSLISLLGLGIILYDKKKK